MNEDPRYAYSNHLSSSCSVYVVITGVAITAPMQRLFVLKSPKDRDGIRSPIARLSCKRESVCVFA
jgi:hypothetical protein